MSSLHFLDMQVLVNDENIIRHQHDLKTVAASDLCFRIHGKDLPNVVK